MSDPLDDLLDTACESLREGTTPGSESGRATQRAVIEGLGRRRRRKDWAMASAVAFCVLFIAPTVWAHVTGRLDAIVAVVMNPPPEPSASARHETLARRRRTAPELEVAQAADLAENLEVVAPLLAEEQPEEQQPEEQQPEEQRPAPEDSIVELEVVAPRRSARARRHRDPPAEVEEVADVEDEEEDSVDVEERELFSRAHRSHFDGGTSSEARGRWDDYLAAYPNGRFVPEARFNRALTLIRLGELAQARRVLERFARGDFGAARRTQAAELLELIAADSESTER